MLIMTTIHDSASLKYRARIYFCGMVLEIDKNLEITNLIGNISLRDDEPMVHAHITLSDENGNAFGGHLVKGTIVFACEFIIYAFAGVQYHRGYDKNTGLPLWNI